ncbi:MAG: hypothetical protein LBC71_04060 [Oscillospiraceae bacterium]|nr:hypothetical protein [Oscillospiraceae bacterium]
MKKFVIAIILLMTTLSFVAPITHVEACSTFSNSLFHIYSTGYKEGGHFTTYGVNGARAWAQIRIIGEYSETRLAGMNGTVTSSIIAGIGRAHEHSAGLW